jgi:ammonium transporter, Amt family
VWIQIVSAFFVIGWNVVWTSLIMIFIKYVLRVPLRMTDAACKVGDYAVHREESYTFAYYNRQLIAHPDPDEKKDLETGIHGLIMGRALPEEARHTDAPRPSGDLGITATPAAVETKKDA